MKKKWQILSIIGIILALLIILVYIRFNNQQQQPLERLDTDIKNFTSLEDCQNECKGKEVFNIGKCGNSEERISDKGFNLGPCLIEGSLTCGDEEQCKCYCIAGYVPT